MTVGAPSTLPMRRLSDGERDRLLADLDRDGFCVLPDRLPPDLLQRCLAAVDRLAAAQRAERHAPAETPVKVQNCVDRDPAFRALLCFPPALQLCWDAFGPMFHLCQSNCISRPDDGSEVTDFLSASPWHADGPRPGMFPASDGRVGLHFLKFGFFLTDTRHPGAGALQVVRGSHRRRELDGKAHGDFQIADYAQEVVTLACAPGTVVAFHQAQWHAAPPNRSPIERKNVYLSYCPTWMRPLDREPLAPGEGDNLTREERWLLGEWRPAMRWWFPGGDDLERLAAYRRDRPSAAIVVPRYD